MIAIVDYGVGNLFSLASSVKSLGLEVTITRDAAELRAADHILLPGVGAFADAMDKLTATGLVPVRKEEPRHPPLLGVSLGLPLRGPTPTADPAHPAAGHLPWHAAAV